MSGYQANQELSGNLVILDRLGNFHGNLHWSGKLPLQWDTCADDLIMVLCICLLRNLTALETSRINANHPLLKLVQCDVPHYTMLFPGKLKIKRKGSWLRSVFLRCYTTCRVMSTVLHNPIISPSFFGNFGIVSKFCNNNALTFAHFREKSPNYSALLHNWIRFAWHHAVNNFFIVIRTYTLSVLPHRMAACQRARCAFLVSFLAAWEMGNGSITPHKPSSLWRARLHAG